MQNSTRHILIGVLTSAFLTPFIGGGVTGYLNGPDVRKGVITGGIVGTIFGSVVSGLILVYTYYGIYQPLSAVQPFVGGEGYVIGYMMPYLLATALLFVMSLISAPIGGGIGSYIAGHESQKAGGRSSTS